MLSRVDDLDGRLMIRSASLPHREFVQLPVKLSGPDAEQEEKINGSKKP